MAPRPIKLTMVLSWIAAAFVAALTMGTFAYSEFRTNREADKVETFFTKRLDRIEQKIDKLLDRNKTP